MEKRYRQLSLEERCKIAGLQGTGASLRQIATALDRAPSTIAREIKRNQGTQGAYTPAYADQQACARRWNGLKLERKRELRAKVLAALGAGWSPEQVAGRLAVESGSQVISHESIYRFLYAQLARTKDYRWRLYLPRAKSKRGRRGRKGGSPVRFFKARRPLSARPACATDRQVPGHWEADLMLFAHYGQAILTMHERHSRVILAARPPGKAAQPIARLMVQLLKPLPQALRQTVTFDNGTEFAQHYQLHPLAIQTFFCDPHKPWQKGGIENAIGRIRRTIPRKTDLATLTTKRFNDLIRAYNNTPRKCLNYQTPAEVFLQQLLHFKCESTFPPTRE